MAKVSIETNAKDVKRRLGLFKSRHIPIVLSESINEVGIKSVNAMRSQIQKKLDRPTPFTIKSPNIIKARPMKNPFATVFIHNAAQKYLSKLFEGGVSVPNKSKIPVPYTAGGHISLNQFGNIRGKRSGLVKGKKDFIANIKGVEGVYRRAGGKRNPHVKLLIGFENSVSYRKTLEFFKTIEGVVKNNIGKAIDKNIKEAFRTLWLGTF